MSTANEITVQRSLYLILDLQLCKEETPNEFKIDTNNNDNTIVTMNENYQWVSLFGKTEYGCMSMYKYNHLAIASVKLKIFIQRCNDGCMAFGVAQSDFEMTKNKDTRFCKGI